MRNLIRTLLTSSLLAMSVMAFAAEQVVDATGYGVNRNLAIADALVQGLRQATGVSIESREVMQSVAGRVSTSDANGDESTT